MAQIGPTSDSSLLAECSLIFSLPAAVDLQANQTRTQYAHRHTVEARGVGLRNNALSTGTFGMLLSFCNNVAMAIDASLNIFNQPFRQSKMVIWDTSACVVGDECLVPGMPGIYLCADPKWCGVNIVSLSLLLQL